MQLLIRVANHPFRIGVAVLVLSVFYTFARVLVLYFVMAALQDAIERYPKTFPHAIFFPLWFISLVIAVIVSLYDDYCCNHDYRPITSMRLWQFVLPLPLTLYHEKWNRLIGISLYAVIIATVEAIEIFNDATMDSETFYREALMASEMYTLREDLGRTWRLLTTERFLSSMFSYVRLLSELFLAVAVCASFALVRFYCESHPDGHELREAARNNDVSALKLFLARGIDSDARSDDGTTALHISGQQAMSQVAQANANVSDRLGFTPLHWAVQMRREEVSTPRRLMTIRILLQHGANPLIPDFSGTTSLQIASRKENIGSLQVLNEFLLVQEIDRGVEPAIHF
ncbi:hypothetical protein PsorP6_004109 [Peronosclerospora sorghi]|uniref:Uncharacterized protein n=1 Tax=Peronosclerospora sorghi TaxID=230839 RepID=A0ACC0VQ08_9STRA|nr:hypothetical protein PsorP6_004109 [Peronosclerospora sorghi]